MKIKINVNVDDTRKKRTKSAENECIVRKRTGKMTKLGIEMKKAMIDLNITQTELAKRAGTSQQYINDIIFGRRTGTKYMPIIAETLKIKLPKEIA